MMIPGLCMHGSAGSPTSLCMLGDSAGCNTARDAALQLPCPTKREGLCWTQPLILSRLVVSFSQIIWLLSLPS
eukprot:1161036-Pelagomonas_calceolata.AAC.7